VVGATKFATGDNRNSNRRKVSFANLIVVRRQLLIARRLITFDLQWRGRVNRIAEWPDPCQCCRLNAGQGPDALEHLFIKNFGPIRFVAGGKKIYRRYDDVSCRKSRSGLVHLAQASKQSSCCVNEDKT